MLRGFIKHFVIAPYSFHSTPTQVKGVHFKMTEKKYKIKNEASGDVYNSAL
jgi:hypothetical protein